MTKEIIIPIHAEKREPVFVRPIIHAEKWEPPVVRPVISAPPSDSQRVGAEQRTAIHEAGHAVVARRLGRPLTLATIEPDGEAKGHVLYKPFRGFRPDVEVTSKTRECLEQIALTALAGGEAERAFLGDVDAEGCSADHEVLAEAAVRATSSSEEADAWIAWLRVHVRNLLRLPDVVVAVKAVAAALLARRMLSAEDVRQISRDAVLAAAKGEVARGFI